MTPAEEERRLFWHKSRSQLESKWYECIRVNGEILCRWCRLPYWRHRQPLPETIPTLVVDCQGRRLKL